MRTRSLIFLLALGILMAAVVSLGLFFPEFSSGLIKFLIIFGMFTAPVILAEETFDLIDKVIDSRVLPEKAIQPAWHFLGAVVLAAVITIAWVQLWTSIVGSNFAGVADVYRYFWPLDDRLSSFGWPAYAWQLAKWAFFGSFLGYLAELLYRKRSALIIKR